MRGLKLLPSVALIATILIGLPAMEAQSQPTTTFQIEGTGGSTQYPTGWFPQNYANAHELWNMSPEKLASLDADELDTVARIKTSVTPVANHAEALQRLREIEAEWGMTSTYVVIGGWPALTRRVLVPKPTEGADTNAGVEWLVMVTTAVATDVSVVRLDGFAPETASADVIAQMESIGRSFRPATTGNPAQAAGETQQLHNSPSLRMPVPLSSVAASLLADATTAAQPADAPLSTVTPGAATNLGTLNLRIGSESEVAVSANGTDIVVAQQCNFNTSTDGGATFTFNGGAPGNCTGGDSSLAVGQSGNFYWSTIGSIAAECPATNRGCNNDQQIASSTNNGQSFTFQANPVDCLVTAGCGFGKVPDQEHIAADRTNASASNQDQVYLVFRTGFGYGITCSTNNAANWSAVTFYNNGSTDFPRITVGQDGTVYVVTNNGNNIELDSFGQCKNGLTHGLNHVTIATGINQVSCPVAGLDRCNNGNLLSSHTVAVDDTNANHLYAAYAVNTVAPAANASFPGNENVLVRESTNGGANWSAAVQVNQGTGGTGGRRFQPWLCVTGGTAFVSWFDRRASTSTSNDLTDYYSSSAFDSAGTLTGGTDFRINGAADPQCASGWPCQSRSPSDSQSCSTQPQLGGACRHTPNNNTDSFTACNFTSPVCPATETCQTGSGCPKYADYTGNACLLGRLYNVWPSATNQPGAVATGGNINSFFAETVVGQTPTTTTYTGPVTAPLGSLVTLSAKLVLKGTSVPVTGQTITFTLGTQTCMGTTNASGVASCTIPLTQAAGVYTVTASFAASGNYQASSDSRTFTIVAPPSIAKNFVPTKILPGGTTSLSFAITNPNSFTGLTGLGFTDSLPPGLLVATPSGLSSTCGGTAIAVPGSGTIVFSGGSIPASAACSISLTIRATNQDGIYNNTTSAVTSVQGGNGNMGMATIIVALPPNITKTFSALAVPAGGTAGLAFTIANPNQVVSLTGVSFNDSLPSGLHVSTPNGLSGTCGGGTITAVPGTTIIRLTGAALAAPGGNCTFSVNVTASLTGALVNLTDPITSDQTVPGGTATATLTVGTVFQVDYSAHLDVGDSVLNMTNTGDNSGAGNVCANVYVTAPDEQLISCCSCLVTPNALASLSIQNDVLSNTLTGVKPASVVLNLVTTLPTSGSGGTSCAGSAVGPSTLTPGLAAWGTTLHQTYTGDFTITEPPFGAATLSAQELTSLRSRCGFIVSNGSGAGICNFCRTGGLAVPQQ